MALLLMSLAGSLTKALDHPPKTKNLGKILHQFLNTPIITLESK